MAVTKQIDILCESIMQNGIFVKDDRSLPHEATLNQAVEELNDLLDKISSFKGEPHIAREICRTGKKYGIKFPEMLLVPGYPRIEGKNAVYSDGTVRPLSEVLSKKREQKGIKNIATIMAKLSKLFRA